LLIRAAELDESGSVTLQGQRAVHLLEILQVSVGSKVKVGLIDGPSGQGEVLDRQAGTVRLRCRFDAAAASGPGDVLFLAMPRPKVLARCLEHAASLGFRKIVVFRSRRSVKSHFDSHVLEPEQIQARLYAGLEQARRTSVPEVLVFTRFRPFVEDSLEQLATPINRYLADPDALLPLHRSTMKPGALTLVIGPEGGLIPYEVAAFSERGFQVVNAGPNPLRVEAALSALTGGLNLLRYIVEDAASTISVP